MAATTMFTAQATATGAPRENALTRFIAGVIKSREEQAQLYVNSVLDRMDDATLIKAGLDPVEVHKQPKRDFPF